MTSSLAEFYSTNYSKCNLTYSFLASWQGLAYPSHIIQVFALPIQILTFYIIWKKTPINMKMMKWPLLINHACCCLCDVLICVFSTPYVFFYNVAGMGVGLLSWLGVPNILQIALGVESASLLLCSFLFVFETRSSLIELNKFRIQKKWIRVMYHISVHTVFSFSSLLLLKIPEDQEAAKLESLKIHPCPTIEYFRNNVIVMSIDPDFVIFIKWIIFPALLVFFLSNIMFHMACTVYHLYIYPAKSTSIATQKSQRNFFIGIVSQTLTPIYLILPVLCIVMWDQINYNVTQEMINMAVVTLGLHGIVESFVVLLVHRPYRVAVQNLIPGNKKIGNVHQSRIR